MEGVGLLVRLLSKPDKEQQVLNLLNVAQEMAQDEPGTSAWFGLRFSLLEFGIFGAFPDEEARQAHLTGRIAQTLKENGDLFEETPELETADVLAVKLPVD